MYWLVNGLGIPIWVFIIPNKSGSIISPPLTVGLPTPLAQAAGLKSDCRGRLEVGWGEI